MEGIVKQLNNNGQVIECSCSEICKNQNGEQYPRKCLLHVDHGNRCFAYSTDKSTWLIAEEDSQVKQIKTI